MSRQISLILVLAAAMGLVLGQCATAAVTVGPAVIDRLYTDSVPMEITIVDPSRTFTVAGSLDQWNLFAGAAVPVKLMVFRQEASGYMVKGYNIVNIAGTGLQTINIAPADRISVDVGDCIGFRYLPGGGSAIKYSNVGDTAELYSHVFSYPDTPATDVGIGEILPFTAFTLPINRTYSLSASVPEPSTMIVMGLGLLGLIRRRRS